MLKEKNVYIIRVKWKQENSESTVFVRMLENKTGELKKKKLLKIATHRRMYDPPPQTRIML